MRRAIPLVEFAGDLDIMEHIVRSCRRPGCTYSFMNKAETLGIAVAAIANVSDLDGNGMIHMARSL